MDPNQFTESSTGRLVPIGATLSGSRYAFVPNPLPPSWKWPEPLWTLLIEARVRLAALDGVGRHLPNPQLLLRPLQTREAQLSSQLEGTITDPQQQVLFQTDPVFPYSAADPNNAFREVFNYSQALQSLRDSTNQLPLSLRLIRNLHAILMQGVRGSDQRPGEFRDTQNQIGRPARFVPPPPAELAQALDAFEKYLHVQDNFDPLVKAFLVHYQFEAIHPFAGGNGRVGRLLLALCVEQWCGLSAQWLYMSPYFEDRKTAYMDLMLGVSTHGHWEPWIEFCLQGVVAQAADTERRCDRLLYLHAEYHRRIPAGAAGRLARLIDSLFISPVLTVNGVKKMLDVTYPTAKADVDKLRNAGILHEILQPPSGLKTFYCPGVFDVIFGPTSLAAE